MCGIVGKIYFQKNRIDPKKESSLIEKSLDILHHRGPDDKGFIIDKNVWLAATRLSIIDLSPSGHQPMSNEDGSLILVFNGEIYNYLELKKRLKKRHKFKSSTDTEVLLHLYEEEGINCLKYLRGMFAFAIWDNQKRELFIARDRIGKKPIKYFYNDKFFVFASELKAFIDHPDVHKEIDWEAVDEFLTYQYVPSPKTGFKNVWKLPPAHYMIVKSSGEVEIRQYWQIDFSQKLELNEKEWQEIICNKLKESVRLRLQSDVPLGIHLSGGIDSGLITALSSQESGKPLKTISIGFEESKYNELPYARLIAQRYHTDHHEVIVKEDILNILPELVYHYEEPLADPSLLPTWLLMMESKKYFTVALNGDGGDENFAGYRRYLVMKIFNLLKFVPFKKNLSNGLSIIYKGTKIKDISNLSWLLGLSNSDYKYFYQDLISFIGNGIKNKLYTQEFKEKIKNSRSKVFLVDKFFEVKELDRLNQLLSIDIETYLPDVLLAKVDISSMVHSQEVRSPFLDDEFMELTAKIPSSLKLKGCTSKYILKKIASRYLPEDCINKRKQGFLPPLEHWFRTDNYNLIRLELLDNKFLSLGIFNKKEIEKLLGDHLNFQSNNSYILWTLIIFKYWYNLWFNSE